jgi:diguanylate cyclase (GGDEF)-like protein
MKRINKKILEEVIASTAEPTLLVRIDQSNWPVVLANPAFASITTEKVLGQPFADVIEQLAGRDLALEVSETVRSQQETNLSVELKNRDYLLALKPLFLPNEESARFYAAFWRRGVGAGPAESAEMHQALLKAKRRIRDLSRDDPVTGLMNQRAFRETFEHDWAVAKREKSPLAVVTFTLDDFDAYLDVFGRHAADSGLRRAGRAIRRCLRRASDVIARTDGARFIVLSHAADEEKVQQFAGMIATSVRELGLHHPRSTTGKFVTVSFAVDVANPADDARDAREYLDDLLNRVAE